MEKKNREYGLDLIRLFAIFFVVVAHCMSKTKNFLEISSELKLFFKCFRTFVTGAVPVFFMLSGAFVLASDSTMDYKKFYKKTWKKLGIPTIIFFIIFFVFTVVDYYALGILGEGVNGIFASIIFVLQTAILGRPADHMWYMFTLISMYLVAPYIVSMRHMLGEKGFKKACVIVWIWGLMSNELYTITNPGFVSTIQPAWGLDKMITFLGMFMMGYLVHEWAKKKRETKGNGYGIALLIIGCLIALVKWIFIFTPLQGSALDYVLGHNDTYSPLNTISAFFWVAAFTIIDFKRDYGYPSALTYWVYLVHPIFIGATAAVIAIVTGTSYIDAGKGYEGLYFCILVISSTILSFITAHLIETWLTKRRAKSSR